MKFIGWMIIAACLLFVTSLICIHFNFTKESCMFTGWFVGLLYAHAKRLNINW